MNFTEESSGPPNPWLLVVSNESSPKKRGRHKTKTNAENIASTAVETQSLFSEKKMRILLRWLKGKTELPDTITIAIPTEQEADSGKTYDKPHSQSKNSLDIQEELAGAIRERLRPWLWSILLHACLLIAMALFFMPTVEPRTLEIFSGFGLREQNELQNDLFGTESEDLTTNLSPQEAPPVEAAQRDPREAEIAETGAEIARPRPSDHPPGLSLGPRDPGSRANSLGAGSGGQMDTVVLEALRWLVRVQATDGSWSLTGRYRNGAAREKENRIAATAMALLALQGYGVTQESRHPQLIEFSKSVREGWNWLLSQQDPKGCFFRDGIHYSHRFYTHSLCTIALCERLAMTGEESLREPTQKAVTYCLQHQSVSGGWRYYPDRWSGESDLSVTGWVVMALKSAEMAGLTVPQANYDKIRGFLDTTQRDDGSQYIYREEEPEQRISMTAEGLLCRILLGWHQDDRRLQRGVQLLVEQNYLPRFDSHYHRDAYYWYYATQTLHHYGGAAWETWYLQVRKEFSQHQVTKGEDAGSWHPHLPVRDQWGNHYGRLYTTCLMVLTLETPYRHTRVY